MHFLNLFSLCCLLCALFDEKKLHCTFKICFYFLNQEEQIWKNLKMYSTLFWTSSILSPSLINGFCECQGMKMMTLQQCSALPELANRFSTKQAIHFLLEDILVRLESICELWLFHTGSKQEQTQLEVLPTGSRLLQTARSHRSGNMSFQKCGF